MLIKELPLLRLSTENDYVTTVQTSLESLGYQQAVTGFFGEKTLFNVKQFQKKHNLGADGIVGQETYTKLFQLTTYPEYLTSAVPIVDMNIEVKVGLPWVVEALRDLGVRETKGSHHTAEVLQMWKDAKLSGIKNDEIPWCAGAMCAWLERAGIRSPRADSARSFATWGKGLDQPEYGCIVVFTRDGGGHVGIVVGQDSKGNLLILGGNQGDMVKVAAFKRDRVSAYRYPEIALPVCSPVDFSTSEA